MRKDPTNVKNLNTIGRITGAILTASIIMLPLAACSGGSPSVPSSAMPLGIAQPSSPASSAEPSNTNSMASLANEPLTTKKLLFVSDAETNKVFVFNAAATTQNPTPLRVITNGVVEPNGITTDLAGNLYVANYANNTVTVYGPGASKPKLTLSNGISFPWDVKVDGFGNVYVVSLPWGNSAYISEFAKGATAPEYTWYVPQQNLEISGIAILNAKTSPSIYATAYSLDQNDVAHGTILSLLPRSVDLHAARLFVRTDRRNHG